MPRVDDDDEEAMGFDDAVEASIPEGEATAPPASVLTNRKRKPAGTSALTRKGTSSRDTGVIKLPILGKNIKGCKSARSRVVLKQGHSKLSLRGNYMSDVFNSAIDEATGILTMFTVYRKFDSVPEIFWIAAGIYSFNIFIRLMIGLNELLNPPKDKDGRPMMRWAQKPDLWLRVIGGLVLIMLEPVSGIWLINSAFEPAPALTKEEREKNEKARDDAINVVARNKEKKKAAAKKVKDAEKDAQKAVEKDDNASTNNSFKEALLFDEWCDSEEKAERLLKTKMAANKKTELKVTLMENNFNMKFAPLLQRLSEYTTQKANVIELGRKFALYRKKLMGAEMVEMVMAAFEDIPEIVLGITFFAFGGLVDSSESDISLFVTSMCVSLFHASKCFWTWSKLREIIAESKMKEDESLEWDVNVRGWDGKLDTYRFGTTDGFFTVPPIEQKVELLVHPERCLITKKLKRARKRMDKENKPIKAARQKVDADSDEIEIEATKMEEWSADAKIALKEFEARKKEEEEIKEQQELARLNDSYHQYDWRDIMAFSSHKMIPVVEAAVRKAHDAVYGRSKAKSKWAMLESLPIDLLLDMDFQNQIDDLAETGATNKIDARGVTKKGVFRVPAFDVKPKGKVKKEGAIKGACGDCGMPVRETHERYEEDGVYYHDNNDDCYRAIEEPSWSASFGNPIKTDYWSNNLPFNQSDDFDEESQYDENMFNNM